MKVSRGVKGQIKKAASESMQEEQIKELGDSVKDFTEKMVNRGLPPKDAAGLSNKLLEGIYAQAYRLYNTGKYVEATHLFRLLILLDPNESKYIMGLAACFHMLKEYKNAIEAYTLCLVLDANNPVPLYHSSDCFIQMKDYPSAILSLEMAIQQAGEKQEFAKLKERALLSLESLKQQQQVKP